MCEQRYPIMRQALSYGAVGGIGTAGHYLVLTMLAELANLDPVIASSFGFIVGALINHELNRIFVFPDTHNNRKTTLLRFMIISTLGFVINLGLMAMMTIFINSHYFVAQLVATGTVFLTTFILNKAWTFGI